MEVFLLEVAEDSVQDGGAVEIFQEKILEAREQQKRWNPESAITLLSSLANCTHGLVERDTLMDLMKKQSNQWRVDPWKKKNYAE